MKKLFTVLVGLLLCTGMVFAAPATEKQSAGSESKGITEIKVMVYERGTDFPSGNSTSNNENTRWINAQLEKEGVRVVYVPIPRSGADNTVNSMLAAGEAPDVIMTYDKARVATYSKQGGLMDLTPYVSRLDPQWLKKAENALIQCQFEGMQYALPRVFEIYGRSHNQYIRKDLVEALGMQMPTTREELIKFLYAVKKAYPDVVPYGFSGKLTDGKYTNFILSYTSRSDEKANYMFEPTFTNVLKEGGKEGLKQLNRFVLDGIIPRDFAVDVDETRFMQNLANGKTAFLLDGSGDDALYPYSTIAGYQLWPVDTLPNADGQHIIPSAQPVSNYAYVPKTSAKKIDAIMKYFSWISNRENALNVEYHIIGKGSQLNEAGIPITRPSSELKAMGFGSSGDLNMLTRTMFFGKDSFLANRKASYPQVPMAYFEAEYAVRYNKDLYYDGYTIGAALDSDQYVPLMQSLIVEMVFKTMNAPEGKFEEEYAKQYKKLLDNNLQQILDERAAYYDTYIKK